MADRFWVGGSGNWDASSTANWAASSGGSAGASAPTSADDVYFDANSNVGTGAFTVTVTGTSASPAACKSFTTGGTGGALDGAMTLTMGATAVLDFYGSMTLPATNFSISGTTGAAMNFRGTTSQTLTTNGVVMTNINMTLLGVGGTLTLGSALTVLVLSITNGTFDTSASNYNVTSSNFVSTNSNVRTINLNGSTLTLSGTTPLNFTTATNLTFNAGTSTITCSNANPTFVGGGQTFYDVSFSSTSGGTTAITGANTYNNLTQTSIGSTGIRFVNVGANQTVNGSLTLGAANTAIRRIFVYTSATGTQRTITLNGSLAALADVDFSDIVAAGTVARPWTGTRIGDAKNNSGITFDTPKTVYWNLAGSQNWSATGWALTNNGTPAVNNFPLAQDTATFTEAGAAGTVTLDVNWTIGSIQMADGVSNRTTAFTLATATRTPNIYGNVTLFSSLTFTGTGALTFAGQGVTQTLTSAGLTLTQPITINSPGGTVQLQDNLTLGSTLTTTLTSGTLDLNNNTLSTGIFSSSNSNARTIAFGTGNITLTGNNATIWNMADVSTFTYTGIPTVNATYSGSTGGRTINHAGTAGGSEAKAMSFNITAGTDIVAIGNSGFYKNLVFTGFAGSLSNVTRTIYGNLTISTGMTVNAGTNVTTFAGTSGIQEITSNGKTLDFPVTFNGVGGTFQLQDNMTVGSTKTTDFTNGTLDLNSKTLTTGLFSSLNTNTRSILFGTGNITLTGNNATIWHISNLTGFTYTGTPTVNCTYAGSTGTRTIRHGNTGNGTEITAVSFNVSAGTDTFWTSLDSNPSYVKNLNFSGFSGTLANLPTTIYGNLTISSGMTLTAGTTVTTFAGTSGPYTITTNGKTIDFPVTFNGINGTWTMDDALTLGSTRALTMINGTLQLKAGTTSTIGRIVTSGATPKSLTSSVAGSQATLSDVSGTNEVYNLKIQDIAATGGATWYAYTQYGNVNAGNNSGWVFSTQGVKTILNNVLASQIIKPIFEGIL